jgi:hypothetical protein
MIARYGSADSVRSIVWSRERKPEGLSWELVGPSLYMCIKAPAYEWAAMAPSLYNVTLSAISTGS